MGGSENAFKRIEKWHHFCKLIERGSVNVQLESIWVEYGLYGEKIAMKEMILAGFDIYILVYDLALMV